MTRLRLEFRRVDGMKNALLLLLLAFVVGPASASDAMLPEDRLESIKTMRVDAWIAVDQQGQLTELTFVTQLPGNLREILETTVRKWRFQPTGAGGAPQSARDKMRITLAAREVGESYQVKVDNVTFRTGREAKPSSFENASARITVKSMRAPRYPAGVAIAGVQGVVLLGLQIGGDGRVGNVIAVQSSLLDVKGRVSVLGEALRQFEEAAVKRARMWRFDVVAKTERLAAADMTAIVPVVFVFRRNEDVLPGVWRTEVRNRPRELTWIEETSETQKIGVSDVAAGEVLSTASTIRLESDVVGTVLL